MRLVKNAIQHPASVQRRQAAFDASVCSGRASEWKRASPFMHGPFQAWESEIYEKDGRRTGWCVFAAERSVLAGGTMWDVWVEYFDGESPATEDRGVVPMGFGLEADPMERIEHYHKIITSPLS